MRFNVVEAVNMKLHMVNYDFVKTDYQTEDFLVCHDMFLYGKSYSVKEK